MRLETNRPSRWRCSPVSRPVFRHRRGVPLPQCGSLVGGATDSPRPADVDAGPPADRLAPDASARDPRHLCAFDATCAQPIAGSLHGVTGSLREPKRSFLPLLLRLAMRRAASFFAWACVEAQRSSRHLTTTSRSRLPAAAFRCLQPSTPPPYLALRISISRFLSFALSRRSTDAQTRMAQAWDLSVAVRAQGLGCSTSGFGCKVVASLHC